MDTRDDEEETDGEHEEAEMLREGVANDSMLKHFFRLGAELLPTCSCTPKSLNPSPLSMPRNPLHVLELWPLLPQLEHFLVIGERQQSKKEMEKQRCAFLTQCGVLIPK
jgi:hypothetical protein